MDLNKPLIMKESFYWIRNCINSSTNNFHLESCKMLIRLFETKYNANSFNEADLYAIDLKSQLREKETFLIVEV